MGAGLGGMPAAYELRELLDKAHRITVVNLPQTPPRHVRWCKKGKWLHLAKIAFGKYFLFKIKTGNSEPVCEKYVLKLFGIARLSK